MTAEMLFIIASLIFGLAVIVGANIWALQDPPESELQKSLSREIEELLDRADGVHESCRTLRPRRAANHRERADRRLSSALHDPSPPARSSEKGSNGGSSAGFGGFAEPSQLRRDEHPHQTKPSV